MCADCCLLVSYALRNAKKYEKKDSQSAPGNKVPPGKANKVKEEKDKEKKNTGKESKTKGTAGKRRQQEEPDDDEEEEEEEVKHQPKTKGKKAKK